MDFKLATRVVLSVIFLHLSVGIRPRNDGEDPWNKDRETARWKLLDDASGHAPVTPKSHTPGEVTANLDQTSNVLEDMLVLKQILEDQDYRDRRCSGRQCTPPLVPPGSSPVAVSSQRRSLIDMAHLYLPDIDIVNPQCQADLRALLVGMVNIESLVAKGIYWPLQFVDSWGKWQDGMLVGNLNYVGFYQECLDIVADISQNISQKHSFRGQYCYITYSKSSNTSDDLQWTGIEEVLEDVRETDAKETQSSLKMPIISPFVLKMTLLTGYGTCMPSTCTQQELSKSVQNALAPAGFKLTSASCYTEEKTHPLAGTEIFGIVFFSLLLALLMVASLADVWITYVVRSSSGNYGALEYLLSFSVPSNLKKLFHLETKRNPQVISCLHGIRFLSIVWVVLGHQAAYTLGATSNVLDIIKLTKKAGTQIITNADKSVDTFFLMSGLLVALVFLRQMESRRKFNAPLFYIHRIIRLLPAIAIASAFVASFSGLMVSGPFANIYRTTILKGCRHNWWMEMSFLSNLFSPYLEQLGKDYTYGTCIPQCWFTSMDMQLYLVSPLLLLPLYYWPKRGAWLLAGWTVVSLIVPGVIIGAYHLRPTNLLVNDPAAAADYLQKVYLMPWCRGSVYLVGFWAAYILHKAREKPSISRLKAWQVLLGWLTSAVVALAVIFGIERYNFMAMPQDVVPQMSLAEVIFYGGLHRPAFGAAVAWVVIACQWGYGGPVNWFLSHSLWQPLSRLTYCIYLTSLPLQFVLICSTKRPTYFTVFNKVSETCGVLLLIMAFSIILTLTAESPVLRLEKLFLQPKALRPRNLETEREVRSECQRIPDEVRSDEDDNDDTSNISDLDEAGQDLEAASTSRTSLLQREKESDPRAKKGAVNT